MKMHENYDTKTFENDIAVLTLDRTVPFSKTVYPICLPPKGELFANRRAFVIGELRIIQIVGSFMFMDMSKIKISIRLGHNLLRGSHLQQRAGGQRAHLGQRGVRTELRPAQQEGRRHDALRRREREGRVPRRLRRAAQLPQSCH